jgi:hypothetical protein
LPASHHPMLATRQLREDPVSSASGGFCAHTTHNPPLDGGAPVRAECRGGSVRLDDLVEGRALGRLAAGGAGGGD